MKSSKNKGVVTVIFILFITLLLAVFILLAIRTFNIEGPFEKNESGKVEMKENSLQDDTIMTLL
ncbi:hypothetical protein WAK64_02185 [Bacillus spongiae]|uniref:YtzI protein n=2 Tax=Bacillus spongiae TaxID=2683610 RepID=A0ABU8H992_9BACI